MHASFCMWVRFEQLQNDYEVVLATIETVGFGGPIGLFSQSAGDSIGLGGSIGPTAIEATQPLIKKQEYLYDYISFN